MNRRSFFRGLACAALTAVARPYVPALTASPVDVAPAWACTGNFEVGDILILDGQTRMMVKLVAAKIDAELVRLR